MKVTIIGAGNMGRGIGTRMVAGGIEVELVDHSLEDASALAEDLGAGATASAEISGEVVVFALPYGAVARAIEEHRAALAGKVVIDIANPVDFSTMDRVMTPEGSSSAEETARLVPKGVSVVKAFNTTFGGTLVAGEVAGQRLDVLIAGDDEEVKRTVASLVQAGWDEADRHGTTETRPPARTVGAIPHRAQEQLGSGGRSALKLHW
jgi:8-hydroxy-5-deazaflavin:NADPH oxidoreductase